MEPLRSIFYCFPQNISFNKRFLPNFKSES